MFLAYHSREVLYGNRIKLSLDLPQRFHLNQRSDKLSGLIIIPIL